MPIWLEEFDKNFFLFINQDLSHPALDIFFPFITDLHNSKWFVWGFFPALLAFLFYRYRLKAVKIFFLLALLGGACDAISYRCLKSSFERTRPNNIPELNAVVRLPHNPQSYSMPSNHALTGAALTTVMVWFFPVSGWYLIPLIVLVSLSRIYVGVHFLSDIVVGALIGIGMSSVLIYLLLRRFRSFFIH